MKVKISKDERGLWEIIVRKTRPLERPTQMADSVTDEDFSATLDRLVTAVAPEVVSETS